MRGRTIDDIALADLRRLHAVFDAMACGVVIADASGVIIEANAAAQGIFGLREQEMHGHTLVEVHQGAVRLDGTVIPLDERPSAVAVRTGHALHKDVLGITRRDGQRRWLQVETVPLCDEGQIRHIISSLADITDRVQAEEALRASEERFRLLSEHASDLVRIVQGDGTILYASPSHQRILGYAPDELRAHRSFDLVHPDDLAPMLTAFNTAIERGDTVINSTYRVRHADGSWRLIEVTASNHLADPVLQGLVINGRDITVRVATEDALRQSEERFRTLIEQAPLCVGVTDEQDRFETVNDAYCSLFGYTRGDLIGHHVTLLFPAWGGPEKTRELDHGEGRREVEARTKSGAVLTVLATTVPLVGADARPKMASFVVDITDRKCTERRLAHLAHHDMLTGLPNRILFHDRLVQALAPTGRPGHIVAVLFLDLDGFKAVNDRHGHEAGDLLLRTVAWRLRGCVRAEDTVARLGGDEFTVLLPAVGSADDVAVVARKIRDELAAPVTVGAANAAITVSIGISLFPRDGEETDVLIRHADRAMYDAKNQGKNMVAFYTHHS